MIAPRPASIALPYAQRQNAAVDRLPGRDVRWLRRLREESLARAVADGVPSPRVERWKYTNLNALAQADFEIAANDAGRPVDVTVPGFLADDVAVHRLLFVNGAMRRELSDLSGLPQGARVESLADLLARAPEELEGRLQGRKPADGLAALNTALMADGVVIRLAAGVRVERPILLIFLGGDAERPVAFHPRNLIIAEPGASATVIELHGAANDGSYWAQPVTEISVGETAELYHYKCQQEGPRAFHLATTDVQVAASGRYENFSLAAGGLLARNEVTIALKGPGAYCRLDGGFLARGRQHIDNTSEIVHAEPNTTSHQAFKGVLDDQGRAVFQGRILVAQDAQKTDGQQSCKTLLLSDRAEIDTKPELEIYADDVKCTHGATAGEIDHDALFYLRARGVGEAEARRMLIEAFLGDVLERIGQMPVREAFAGAVARWLGAGSEAGR